MHPVLPAGMFLAQKMGFHVSGCPGVPRACEFRGFAAFTSWRTHWVTNRGMLPEAYGSHTMAPCFQPGGKKMREKIDSQNTFLNPATLQMREIGRLVWMVPVKTRTGMHNAWAFCGVVVTLHGIPSAVLGAGEIYSVLCVERRQVKTE